MIKKWFASSWVRFFIGLSVSLLLLYLAFRSTTFIAVWEVLSQADWLWVVAAVLSVAGTNLAKTLRWQGLLGQPGKAIPFLELLMSNLSGQMLNTIFPVRIGDLSRAYRIGGMGPGRVFVLGTVILEKIIDALWLALLFLLLLITIPLPGWARDSAWLLIAAACLIGGLTFLLAAHRQPVLRLAERLARRLPQKQRDFLLSRMHNGLDSLDILHQRRDLLKLAWWSTLIWGLAVLTNYLTLLALGIEVALGASLLILLGLMVGISVAVVPGRIGVFEWICVLALAVYGIEQTPALGYGLLLHAIVYIPTTLAGVLSFFIQARGSSPQLPVGW